MTFMTSYQATLPAALACAVFVLASMPATGEELRGFASVQSGNQILIGKRIVRLFGIKAPGKDDVCEIEEAKNEMRHCRLVGIDPLGRWPARLLRYRTKEKKPTGFRVLLRR